MNIGKLTFDCRSLLPPEAIKGDKLLILYVLRSWTWSVCRMQIELGDFLANIFPPQILLKCPPLSPPPLSHASALGHREDTQRSNYPNHLCGQCEKRDLQQPANKYFCRREEIFSRINFGEDFSSPVRLLFLRHLSIGLTRNLRQ